MRPDEILVGRTYEGADGTQREVVYDGDAEVFSLDSTTDYTNGNGWDVVTEHGRPEFAAWAVREVNGDEQR